MLKNLPKSNYDLLEEMGVFITLVLRWEKNLTPESVDALLRVKDNVNLLKARMRDDSRA
jgi:transcriptional regulator with XRE-family HTH domain